MFRVFFAAILLFCAVIEAANTTNEFVNPPTQTDLDLSRNPVYKTGDIVHLEWTTNYKRASLVFRQLNATDLSAITSGSSFVKQNLNNSQTSHDWKVILFNTNIDLSHVFYFMVLDTSDGKNNETVASRIKANNQTQFTSHWFNITKNAASSSSGNANTNANQSELGYPANVGIGVGVGVGCAFLIALGVAIWYLRRRIKALASQSEAADDSHLSTENDDASKPPASASEPAVYEKDTDRQPAPLAEVHSNALVEMPAERGVELPNQQQEVRYELP